ncbi:MAG: tRNA pseudouridine(55) synthase TruB [Clostridiales bacterium]|jgi:tRNA pseudouridine55 synthase|nr:tRNA pseudouridine(55) synthase TruB [Clostridiales bacterium]
MLNGIIVLDKSEGVSSAFLVGRVKHILKEYNSTENFKVGHFGTLDPFASGVLPIALGRATRLFKYHLANTKQYYARFYFGKETNTLDTEGIIIKESSIIPNITEIQKAIKSFIGNSSQKPPLFSANSINGVRAYKLARAGIDFDLGEKEIKILSFDLIKQVSNNEFDFRIVCSSGTYIRSICRDLAAMLGSVGHINMLRRESSGIFKLENAIKIIELNSNNILSYLNPLELCVPQFDSIDIDSASLKDLMDGKKVVFMGQNQLNTKKIVKNNNKIVAICTLDNGILSPDTWLI